MNCEISLSPALLRLVASLDHFRGVWSSGTPLPTDRLARLREAAHVQSVAAACRMSGIRLADLEVAGLLGGEPPVVREAKEVRGYSEALLWEFPSGALVTTLDLRWLNARALGSAQEPSPWREVPNHVEAFDAQGRALGRVIQTLPPRVIPDTLEDLVTWLEIGLKDRDRHPLLVIGSFVLAFLAASPFHRGNIRTSCLLAVKLLRRAGYDHLPYASLEREFEEAREAFYDAFDASTTRLWTGEANLEPWLAFFLEALERHAERVASKMDLERRSLEFSPLQRMILDTVREHGSAAASLLLTATGTNRNTLKDNLRRLVAKGVLEQMGRRRGATYRLAGGNLAGSAPAPVARLEPRVRREE